MYDAFISYSHALDRNIAAALQSVVQTLGKPWWRLRVSRVFRDDTSLSATPHLWPSIEQALKDSRFLVLLASPESGKSKWVGREVAAWLETKNIDTLLIALTAGDLTWDDESGDFRRTKDAPIPPALFGRFKSEPLWIDLRPYRSARQTLGKTDQGFLAACAGFVAAIRNLPKDEIFSEEVKQQRRNLMWARGAVASLLILAGAATWQAIRATNAQHVAEAERDRAQRTLNQVVATANRRVWALSLRLRMSESPPHDNEQPVACNDPLEIGRDGLPCSLKQAQIRLTRSATLLARNDGIGAIESAEAAVAILEGGAGARASDSAWQLARLEAGDQLVRAAEKVGDWPRALKALLTSLALAETLAKERPDEIKWEQALAGIEDGLGFLALQQKQYADAERHYQTALALRDRIAGRSDGAIEARRQQAIANGRIGDLLLAMEKPRQAAELYRGSITILESLVGTSSAAVELQRDLSVQYQHLADALTAAGSLEEAQHWLKKDVGIAQRLAAADRENPHLLHDLATSYDRLAKLAKRADRPSEALESYVEADRILEAIIGKDTSPADWQRDAAAVLESMGMLISERGDPNRAIATFRHALALREGLAASFEDPNWQTELEAAYKQTSESILKLGQAREALETAEQYLLATSLAPDQGADKPKRVARALGTVSWSALFARDVSRALWASKEAIAIAPQLDWLKLNYAHALMLSGDPEAARTVYLGGLAQAGDKADTWRKDIRSDFAELKSRGLSHQLMAEIESSLNR